MTMLRHAALAALFALPAAAQWFDLKHKGLPRNPDGTVNLTAPAPKQADGKPDLSGIWLGDNWQPKGRRPNPPARVVQTSKMLPAALETNMKEDPKVRCLPNGVPHANTEPYPFEIVHTPDKT